MDYPKKKGSTVDRTYVIHAEEAEEEPDTTWIIGATHSFISKTFITRLKIIPKDLGLGFKVFIPSGDQMVTTSIVNNLELRLKNDVVRAYLVVLLMPEFDIILGMDWLSSNESSIDFRQMSVFDHPVGNLLSLRQQGTRKFRTLSPVSVRENL
ncbi:uncharacterized protein LOC142519686 [Primulina tabacum]|uniref:uncharacterized protein LOC142519686 n=1 Tax=Primulina tabacum TaxID=48773 RepID=UPI003F596434